MVLDVMCVCWMVYLWCVDGVDLCGFIVVGEVGGGVVLVNWMWDSWWSVVEGVVVGVVDEEGGSFCVC